MGRKTILIGSILAVALLTFVSFSNVVGYQSVKTSQEELIESECSFDNYTPIQLVFLLINKLRYYEGIASEEDVMEIIENDAEFSGIVEELKSYSCGCEEDTNGWNFPIICLLLTPFFVISALLFMLTNLYFPALIIVVLGNIFNCQWNI